VAAARTEKACAECHSVDPQDPDVHVQAGLRCLSCHTSREIHGDGRLWDSANQPGALEVRCQRCHERIQPTASHTVHGGKLDCAACHTRAMDTCFNCHIGARLAGAKEASIKRDGLLFLVNHDGKVGLANFLSYVYGKGTMVTLAPTYPHAIARTGRACADCHATANARDVAAGRLVLSRFVGGELRSAQGVIPVADGMKWDLAFLDREGDRWVPLADAKPPLVNYSWCTPLSRTSWRSCRSRGAPRPADRGRQARRDPGGRLRHRAVGDGGARSDGEPQRKNTSVTRTKVGIRNAPLQAM